MRILCTLFVFIYLPLQLSSQVYSDFVGAGHDEGVIVTSSSQGNSNQLTINGSGLGNDLIGASRFMSHATLGARLEDLMYVDSIGYEAWIEEQMEVPRTSYLETLEPINDVFYEYHIELGGDPEDYFVTSIQFRCAWSHIIMNAPDALRHRVALALSELLVISDQSDLQIRGFGLADYYDVLSKHAFGNYKDLLMEVTRHPTMGFYLGHLNNPKSDPINNIHPDENYAREIMQLFSIGLHELNPDGSRVIGPNNQAIPTYDNDDIKGLAKVFTGLGMGAWADPTISNPTVFGLPMFFSDMTVPMKMYEFWHEKGEKHIVGDFTIPDGQTGMEDIEMAIDHLFNHPNVGPFIGKQLIQRLVKSNPSASYIERITNVFNDNGNGVRGDLGAVVAAILLDEEARNCNWINNTANGRLKEPIQRYTQYVKGFDAKTETWFWNQGVVLNNFTDQYVLSSPTVFNFFLPDYQPNSAIADENLVAPEFQIFNSSTSVGYMNIMYFMAIADYNNDIPEEELEELGVLEAYKAILTAPQLVDLSADPDALIDYFDLVLAHGNMSEATRATILAACTPLATFPEAMVKMALYLTMISPDYVIMK